MATAALSIAGFSAYVASSSNISASQQAFQSLQQALASGNLSAAQTAFTKYQSVDHKPDEHKWELFEFAACN